MSRVAFVTGAARGMGAAICRALSDQGCSVVGFDAPGADRFPALIATPSTEAELRASLASLPTPSLACVGDVTRIADLRAAVEATKETFGGLDIVVAAAGVVAGGVPFWDIDEDAWDQTFAINTKGVWNTLRATAPLMLERPRPRSGRIVAIASVAGLVGMGHMAPYVASKHAVTGLVRSAAADLGTRGITVNAVCPGSTRTGMLEDSSALFGNLPVETFSGQHLTGTLIEPEEIAAAV
ncbi:MAG: SDR family NAD(P)-dependent oxidoreductase, partial [Acidimicrobiia bacterium]